MKRRAFKLLLFLLAGAIINVAVAWLLALTINTNHYSDSILESKHASGWYHPTGRESDYSCLANFFYLGGRGFGRMLASYQFGNIEIGDRVEGDALGFIPTWGRGVVLSQQQLEMKSTWAIIDARGWPALSLTCEARYRKNGKQDLIHFVGLVLPSGKELDGAWRGEIFALPFQPIWPGFAINTIFFAAALWVLLAAPGKVRRWRRIQRGQCASCGYSLRENTSEKCPECGHGEEENAASTRAL